VGLPFTWGNSRYSGGTWLAKSLAYIEDHDYDKACEAWEFEQERLKRDNESRSKSR